jgi:hypothetical protein
LKVLAVQPEQIKRVINDWRLLLGDVLEQLKGRTSFLVQGNNLTVNDCILDIECSNRISDGREFASGLALFVALITSICFCEVPPAQELSEAQLLEHIQAGYGSARRQALDQELARLAAVAEKQIEA